MIDKIIPRPVLTGTLATPASEDCETVTTREKARRAPSRVATNSNLIREHEFLRIWFGSGHMALAMFNEFHSYVVDAEHWLANHGFQDACLECIGWRQDSALSGRPHMPYFVHLTSGQWAAVGRFLRDYHLGRYQWVLAELRERRMTRVVDSIYDWKWCDFQTGRRTRETPRNMI